jgi:hypothetical protein
MSVGDCAALLGLTYASTRACLASRPREYFTIALIARLADWMSASDNPNHRQLHAMVSLVCQLKNDLEHVVRASRQTARALPPGDVGLRGERPG